MTTYDAGLDLGATLTKVVRAPSGAELDLQTLETLLLPSGDRAGLSRFLEERPLATIGATGAGARAFASRAAPRAPMALPDEFAAWAAGERVLLSGAGFAPGEPHLLVSIGTGTSVLRITDGAAVRVGGTALGGGTLRGLGALLLAEPGHAALVARAAVGDSRRVDLLVSDLYREGEIPIDVDLTAASFGRVEGPEDASRPRSAEDLAAAATRLVAENVALLAGAWAAAHGASDIVYAGSTLRGNELLRRILAETTALSGRRALFLPSGEFAGAIGAARLARGGGG